MNHFWTIFLVRHRIFRISSFFFFAPWTCIETPGEFWTLACIMKSDAHLCDVTRYCLSVWGKASPWLCCGRLWTVTLALCRNAWLCTNNKMPYWSLGKSKDTTRPLLFSSSTYSSELWESSDRRAGLNDVLRKSRDIWGNRRQSSRDSNI
jgi:hypothetical protein